MSPTAVPVNSNGNGPIEDATKPPAGVVLPPKDIRAIVEKTADYVSRNGQVFEQRIREKEKFNPKFSFLAPVDAYHAFYQWRLSEIKAGRGTVLAASRSGAPGTPSTPVPEAPKGPKEPPEFRFSAKMPNISAQDLDVLRLTALFVARNGRQFMTALSQRESRNYQFDFLRPNHSLYSYFSRLVDQYTDLLKPDTARNVGDLKKNVEDKFHVLEKAKERAEWTKYQEAQKQKAEEEAEAEKIAYAQIDWHDFVVVETVEFTEADELADLPPPISLSDLQHASLQQKAMMSLQSSQLRIEEAMPTSDMYMAPMSDPVVQPMPQPQQQPMYPTAMDTSSDAVNTQPPAAEPAKPETPKNAPPSQMKIRQDYVPRAAAAAASRRGQQMALCPNCHQQIPVNELEEHMRIELLDPRWKEQRARAEARFATTNLNSNDAANNLKRLASARADLFDDAGQGISEEEQERRKRAATGWDGSKESREDAVRRAANVNVQEQIRAIHEKQNALMNPGVGPKR